MLSPRRGGRENWWSIIVGMLETHIGGIRRQRPWNRPLSQFAMALAVVEKVDETRQRSSCVPPLSCQRPPAARRARHMALGRAPRSRACARPSSRLAGLEIVGSGMRDW